MASPDAMQAETISLPAGGGDDIEAYFARPIGAGPYPSVVVIHHMPGYDRASKEITRTFGAYGYAALMPNLFHRYAPFTTASDAAAAARAAGGVPDDQCLADVAAAASYLRAQPSSNGKVGVIGYCSGGRQTYLVACSLDVDAAVDCYGGAVVETHTGERAALIEKTAQMRCPLLGLFGADDRNPSPAHVVVMDEELTKHGKVHEFHTYEGAGHAFFSVDRPSYNVEAAKDGWKQIWAFFGRYLKEA
jgi:carboxymethylenebutenolidase